MAHVPVSDLMAAPEVLSHVSFATRKAGLGEIPPATLSEDARRHLAGCASCRKGLADLRTLAELTEALARRIPPSRFRARAGLPPLNGPRLVAGGVL